MDSWSGLSYVSHHSTDLSVPARASTSERVPGRVGRTGRFPLGGSAQETALLPCEGMEGQVDEAHVFMKMQQNLPVPRRQVLNLVE